ncbi:MAG: DNA mismatch repair protein [Haloarculaceae archaeon]
MRLEEYWGVGPKTREQLERELGTERAVEAIESADVRALVEAGIPRGRATRILRRASGGNVDLLATGDARDAYRELLDLAGAHALTRNAADRIRVLTPLNTREEMDERLDRVLAARDVWTDLDEGTKEAVVAAFETYDEEDGGERAAAHAAIELVSAGVVEAGGPFEALADLDPAELEAAAEALAALDGGDVARGVDDRLDRLRDARAAADRLATHPGEVIESVESAGVRGTDAFRDAFVSHVAEETELGPARVREAMPQGAADATAFVHETLTALEVGLREEAEERAAAVRADLESAVETAREDLDTAVSAVDEVALDLSLARFAAAYDLQRPEFAADTFAVVDARNLSLLAGGADVQPITYALGDHDVEGPPTGDRVAILTGANSGGKTTLLETLCQVALLAQMGLPVPAARAVVSPVDSVVFHRRHASFNAGVLESTLRSVVPPLTGGGRTLMLVDEFEAITEPGSAADLLHGLVTLTVDRGATGVFVTHLAEDLEPLPERGRVDGIFAEGLTPDLELAVDYQPRFDTLGKSTPEFIVSRLVADATDRAERAGYEHLVEAVGEEAVQRTLSDVRWN